MKPRNVGDVVHKSKRLCISTQDAEGGEGSEGNSVGNWVSMVSVGNPGRREDGLAVCWAIGPVLKFLIDTEVGSREGARGRERERA